jgi:hypothetical protein
MDGTAPGADRWASIVRERYNKMEVVIATLQGINSNNVWEVEQLRDSFEMHRIWHPFCCFCRETKLYQKLSNPVFFSLSDLLSSISTLQLIHERTKSLAREGAPYSYAYLHIV